MGELVILTPTTPTPPGNQDLVFPATDSELGMKVALYELYKWEGCMPWCFSLDFGAKCEKHALAAPSPSPGLSPCCQPSPFEFPSIVKHTAIRIQGLNCSRRSFGDQHQCHSDPTSHLQFPTLSPILTVFFHFSNTVQPPRSH